MKLPSFLFKKNNNLMTYLGIFLKEEEGIIMVLSVKGENISIKEKEHFSYSDGWEHIVQDIDEVLFRFEQRLNLTIDQTIFFIYSHFVDEKTHEIKRPYLQKIKEIVKNLELKVLGYIECSEAVSHFIEKKEEIPLTAVLIELDKTNVGIFVYKGGKVAYSKILSRTDNLIDDLLTGFEDLKGKFLLPSRIILYDSKDLDDQSSKILMYKWSQDYFIQLPRVEIISEEEVLEGLVNVFYDQIKMKKETGETVKKEKKEVFGFVIDQDIEETKNSDVEMEKKWQLPELRFPKINIPAFNFSKKILISLGVFFILTALFLNEFFLHKATITVFVPVEKISRKTNIKDLEVKVSTSSAVFTVSKQTTGKIEVGDKAKGTVIIHNFDDKEKIFAKGTVLETQGLSFVLDEEVKVASSSLAADGSAKLPGKKSASVTALSIGPESNLEKKKRFKIDDLSTSMYFAINEENFTGGTRKYIKTVSKNDQEDLKADILAKAKTQGLSKKEGNNLQTKNNEEIISSLSEVRLRDLNFSKEVGEETDEVSLTATVDVINYSFRKDELLDILVNELKSLVKDGYYLDKKNIHYQIDSAEKKDNKVILNLLVNAKALKDINPEKVANSLIGRNTDSLASILKKDYQIDGFELTIKGSIPFLNKIFPFFKDNIRVIISSL